MPKNKTKPPMPPGPEADGHNLDETVVPRKPMTAEKPAEEPAEPTPQPTGEGTGEGGEGSEEPGEGTGEGEGSEEPSELAESEPTEPSEQES